MSPQGRKRVAGMVSRDYQTVSGVGGTQTYPNQVRYFASHGNMKGFSNLFFNISSSTFSRSYNEEANQYR
jgi:hypothetical protein